MDEIALPVGWQLGVNMTVDHQQINPAVVVIIKKLGAPTDIGETNGCYLSRVGDIRKRTFTVIVIESVVVVIEISNKHIQSLVVIIVTQRHSHAALLTAVFIHRHSRRKSDFFERAITVVVIEEVRR